MRRLVLLLLAVGAAVLLLRGRRSARPGSLEGRGPSDPWEVLGVPRGASRQEITRAYRERLKEYHPDRVAQLGAELQELAHRKTVEIRRAYEALSSGS